MYKKVKAVVTVLCVCMLCACSGSLSASLTFAVGTGDNIKVTLDISDGLGLSQTENGFAVTKEEENILQALFVEEAVYQQYMDVVKEQEGVTINRQGSENGITVVSYSYNGAAGMENNYIVWIEGTDTGMIIGSLADLQTADAAFRSLSFSKE